MSLLENRTFDEIAVGDEARIERALTPQDLQLFTLLSGVAGPVAADATSAEHAPGQGVIAHGMWAAALVAGLLGTRLPGPGSTYVSQSLDFLAPIKVGDILTIEVQVRSRDPQTRRLGLHCRCTNQLGTLVIEGQADLVAPSQKIVWARTALPEVRLQMPQSSVQRLMDHVRPLGPIKVAVVHPCDEVSLASTLQARDAGLITPVLIAPLARLQATADAAGLDLSGLQIEDVPHSHAAAARAVEMASQGLVEALMKGSLHTDELMSAVVSAAGGLRTKRRMSHCFVMQTPAYPRPFIITDAAINIAPTLMDKADIVRNAIDLAHALGVEQPRVAILAAVETVMPGMPATLDAAALCKMADRGQITGALLDGPLAFDNAVSMAAATIKGIVSPVAGQADILVVPDLESGNMLAKQLEYLGGADTAGIALGAKVPIILTSRADSAETRLTSCAVAVLLAHRYRDTPP